MLSEYLFAIIYVIAALVFWEFIKSKDGILRKIMIGYFIVEVYAYLGSAIYFLLVDAKVHIFGIDIFRIIIITPKAIMMLCLWWWMKWGRKTKGFH